MITKCSAPPCTARCALEAALVVVGSEAVSTVVVVLEEVAAAVGLLEAAGAVVVVLEDIENQINQAIGVLVL